MHRPPIINGVAINPSRRVDRNLQKKIEFIWKNVPRRNGNETLLDGKLVGADKNLAKS